MPVNVIDTIKPKNGLSFPIVEAVDVAVSENLRLPAALAAKADTSDISAVNEALSLKAPQSALDTTNASVALKANASDVASSVSNLQSQIDSIITPTTEDAEVINARITGDGTTYQTLKARLDATDALTAHADASSPLPSCNLNTVTSNGIWLLVSGNTYENFIPDPTVQAGYLFVFLLDGWSVQFFLPFSKNGIYRRASHVENVWSAWTKITDDDLDDLTNTVDDLVESVSHNNEFNRFDAIVKNALRTNITDAGVTYSWNGDVCTVSGTASGNSFCNIFNSFLNVSDFRAGDSYYIIFNDAVSDQVYIRIYFSSDGSTWSDPVDMFKSGYFTIPSGTVRMTIRFQVNQGTAVSCSTFCSAITHAPIKNYSENQTLRLDSCDLNTLRGNQSWLLANTKTYENLPSDKNHTAGYLFTYEIGGWRLQLFIPFSLAGIYRRATNDNNWQSWTLIADSGGGDIDELTDTVDNLVESVSHNNEFNRFDAIANNALRLNITDAGITYSWNGDICTISGTASGNSFCNVFNSYLNVSDFKAGESYYLLFNDSVSSQVYIRIYFSSDGSSWSDPVNLTKSGYFTIPAGTVRMTIRFQVNTGTTVSCNSYCFAITHAPIENYSENQPYRLDPCDLNDLHGNQSWLIASSKTYENLPSDKNHTAGYLFTYEIGGWRLQVFIPFTWTGIYRRAAQINTDNWQSWTQIAESGGGDVYNITNEYTVEATPSITSDTNNYLAPTGDNSDVKFDIITMLNDYGVCRLGPGDYYVSGVDMPDDTMLIGSGPKTRVILLGSNSTTGYAIKLGNRCSVKDMSIVGSTTDIRYDSVSSNIVDRHGILFEAQYDYDESYKERCNIDNVWIRFFTGGGITCRNTGYGTSSCVNVSNAYIYQCNAGVYIPYWSEFHRFINVHARYCYYGAVNNGGNCSFVNCCFSSNRVGMLMDNSTGEARNNSHGQVVACIFDHSDGNNGVGLLIDGMRNGEVFSDCQVFYSDIVVRNSSGIQFNNFNFGGAGTDITVEKGSHGGLIMFNNCVFEVSSHTITVEQGYTACKFVNCWKKDGTAVTG